MDEEKLRKLKVMRFWLFGTFVIVWVAITIYIGLFLGRQEWLYAIRAGFPIWGIVGGLCIVWYLGYSWWLKRS